MEESTFKHDNENPSFYENKVIYNLPYTEEFIEIKIHMKSAEKYNTARAYIGIMMEKLVHMLR